MGEGGCSPNASILRAHVRAVVFLPFDKWLSWVGSSSQEPEVVVAAMPLERG